ncbi:LacI family DNA-binding transcriptional regulator [Curtobacterium sp. L1-20]|uniref:LacI family DNA-binding transcriptional regulator n=1 Tax=Curtobacterium sp. L1-20 TaxID=3138181 RepID=UPI003B52C4A9
MSERARRHGRDAVTIRDVAGHAGVSTATVSRVLAGTRPVRRDIADRVVASVAALGYRPNPAARALSSGTLAHLAVVVPSLTNPYFYEIVDQLNSGATAAGFRLLVADSGGDPEAEWRVVGDLRSQVAGIFLLSPRMAAGHLRQLADEQVRLVLVNRVEPSSTAATVAVDNARAAMRIAAHLLELGHRRIAYLGGQSDAWQDQERWRGFQAAAEFGMIVTRLEGSGTLDVDDQIVERLLAADVTAVACFNDLSAIALIGQLRDRGVSVPGQLSITGFDDIPIARFLTPALTTVNSPTVELGERAWSLMEQQLRHDVPLEPVMLEADLLLRGSTGPSVG